MNEPRLTPEHFLKTKFPKLKNYKNFTKPAGEWETWEEVNLLEFLKEYTELLLATNVTEIKHKSKPVYYCLNENQEIISTNKKPMLQNVKTS